MIKTRCCCCLCRFNSTTFPPLPLFHFAVSCIHLSLISCAWRGVSPLSLFFLVVLFTGFALPRNFVIQYDFVARFQVERTVFFFSSLGFVFFAYRRWARTSCFGREDSKTTKSIRNRFFVVRFSLIKCDRSGISRFFFSSASTSFWEPMEWGDWRQYGN